MHKIILLVTVLAVFFCGRSLAEPLEITITIPRTASDLATRTYSYDVIDVDTPVETTNENIKRYREQLDRLGFSFDWSREIRTSSKIINVGK